MKNIYKTLTYLMTFLGMTFMLSFGAFAESEQLQMTEENKIPLLIFLVIALVAAIIIVNWLYRLWMKITDADMMFYSKKTKLIIIGVVTIILWAGLCKLFGIY